MIPMTGWISSRFGRKRYFMTSVSVFVIVSALCGAAASLDQMVVFRLIQGAAGAAMVPMFLWLRRPRTNSAGAESQAEPQVKSQVMTAHAE